jgi:dTMP kinase
VNWCKSPDHGLPRPDIVVYLSISVEEAIERGDFGYERYEKADFQHKVKAIFEDKLVKLDPRENWYKIDATRSIEDIHSQLYGIALKVIKESADQRVESLWL